MDATQRYSHYICEGVIKETSWTNGNWTMPGDMGNPQLAAKRYCRIRRNPHRFL